jgi:hypothetical protein
MSGTAPNYLNQNTLIGTTVVPAGATFNVVLGGGGTTPVLGPATADIVNLAAVDIAAGDRRLSIQSELGSPINIGNNRLDFGASLGTLSVGGTDILSLTSSVLTISSAVSTLTLADGVNIEIGSTTGTVIGTSTSEKLGFWGASPVGQYDTVGSSSTYNANASSNFVYEGSTFPGGVGSTAYKINDIITALKKCGILAK